MQYTKSDEIRNPKYESYFENFHLQLQFIINIKSDINLIKNSVTQKHLRLQFVNVQLRQVDSIKTKSKIALLLGFLKIVRRANNKINATRKTDTSLDPSLPQYVSITLKRVELLQQQLSLPLFSCYMTFVALTIENKLELSISAEKYG